MDNECSWGSGEYGEERRMPATDRSMARTMSSNRSRNVIQKRRKRKKETKGRTRWWMLWELEGVQEGTRQPTGGSVLRDGRQPGRTARDTTRRT